MTKGHEEVLGDRHVHYLDCGDSQVMVSSSSEPGRSVRRVLGDRVNAKTSPSWIATRFEG